MSKTFCSLVRFSGEIWVCGRSVWPTAESVKRRGGMQLACGVHCVTRRNCLQACDQPGESERKREGGRRQDSVPS